MSFLALAPELQAAAEPVVASWWNAGRIAGLVFAFGVIGLGFRLILLARSRSRSQPPASSDAPDPASNETQARKLGWFAGLSAGTQMVMGLSLVLIAYHIAAWVSPLHWFPLQLPSDRWWVVFLLSGIGIGGSLLAERLERD
ncbi:MAG: hypothetical protein KGS45_10820 [Planctomycetes bacterium]|nr:hypothetical protein [Planctomycetota bacterium]